MSKWLRWTLVMRKTQGPADHPRLGRRHHA